MAKIGQKGHESERLTGYATATKVRNTRVLLASYDARDRLCDSNKGAEYRDVVGKL